MSDITQRPDGDLDIQRPIIKILSDLRTLLVMGERKREVVYSQMRLIVQNPHKKQHIDSLAKICIANSVSLAEFVETLRDDEKESFLGELGAIGTIESELESVSAEYCTEVAKLSLLLKSLMDRMSRAMIKHTTNVRSGSDYRVDKTKNNVMVMQERIEDFLESLVNHDAQEVILHLINHSYTASVQRCIAFFIAQDSDFFYEFQSYIDSKKPQLVEDFEGDFSVDKYLYDEI